MKKNILITGNSKGIGKYLFENLKKENHILGFSRSNGYDLTKLNDIKNIKIDGILDLIILNAGVGEFGVFEKNPLEDYENIINLNLFANIRLLKILEKNIDKFTKIIFIGSIIGKKSLGGASVYQASKFGLRGFSLGLKAEGKKVFLINPQIVNTDFHKNKVEINDNLPKTSLKDILKVIKNIIEGNENRFEIDL